MCSSGDYRHTSTGGLSYKGKVTILSSLIWGMVPCYASKRDKMAGKLASFGIGAVAVSLIAEKFCGGWQA